MILRAATPVAAQTAIPLESARAIFAAVRALDRPDLAALWGRRLACPLILADQASRTMVATHADSGGALREVEGGFAGPVPDQLGIANTAISWGGRRWTMVAWPLPPRARDRDRLLGHELLHCLQPELGFEAKNPTNAHLDGLDGRLWLRMEWRALEEALVQSGAARRTALEDALRFRAHRWAIVPGAEAEERALEQNEGLAEYTGLRASGWPSGVLADRAAVDLASWERRPSFSRSFAYATGPAYGILLDEAGGAWRPEALQGADLGALAARAHGIGLEATTVAELERRGARYDLPRVRQEEEARAERAAAVAADLTRRFVDGPVLRILPNEQFNYTFDPNAVQPFREGTVHRTTRVTDVWGVLEVRANGAWLARRGGMVEALIVPAPPGVNAPLAGDGWTLTLAEGWVVVPGARAGDWLVTRR